VTEERRAEIAERVRIGRPGFIKSFGIPLANLDARKAGRRVSLGEAAVMTRRRG
jgi:hypothetical protein